MGALESPDRRNRLIAAGAVIAVLVVAAAVAWRVMSRSAAAGAAVRARDIPGQGERVVVEVLNASGQVGLARAATRRLRDEGLDVVFFGNDPDSALDSTQVLLRRGDDDRAQRVRRALGTGSVRPAPDSTRLVDVTVRLGRDFTLILRNP